MSLVDKIFSTVRLRDRRSKLADSPSVQNYLSLAQEHVQRGEMQEVQRVCAEALELYPSNAELLRLVERARELEREDRTRELYRQLREAPRSAIYRELCEILLASNRIARAEDCAAEWYSHTGDGNAQLVRAEARTRRFLADKRRDDGRLALELVAAAEKLLPNDVRTHKLELEIYERIGAWRDAQRVLARLLEIEPGDPNHEARYRAVSTRVDRSPNVDQALRLAEKEGRLVDDEPRADSPAPSNGTVRPRLQAMVAEEGVHAAVYVRGATALVQGPKGATAERHARAVREVVQKSAGAARKLGLGQATEIAVEGDFGTLLITPGELASAALWLDKDPEDRHRRGLVELAGLAGVVVATEEAAS
ncbi:MAG: hypothetical protein HZA52_10435 [Planctomycetes bacterium]|nr:hypothetical protein [Planctomycetota bacterium]